MYASMRACGVRTHMCAQVDAQQEQLNELRVQAQSEKRTQARVRTHARTHTRTHAQAQLTSEKKASAELRTQACVHTLCVCVASTHACACIQAGGLSMRVHACVHGAYVWSACMVHIYRACAWCMFVVCMQLDAQQKQLSELRTQAEAERRTQARNACTCTDAMICTRTCRHAYAGTASVGGGGREAPDSRAAISVARCAMPCRVCALWHRRTRGAVQMSEASWRRPQHRDPPQVVWLERLSSLAPPLTPPCIKGKGSAVWVMPWRPLCVCMRACVRVRSCVGAGVGAYGRVGSHSCDRSVCMPRASERPSTHARHTEVRELKAESFELKAEVRRLQDELDRPAKAYYH